MRKLHLLLHLLLLLPPKTLPWGLPLRVVAAAALALALLLLQQLRPA